MLVNATIVLLSFFVVIFAFEVALRAEVIPSQRSNIVYCSGVHDRRVHHPVLGWTERASQQFLRRENDQWNRYTFNEEGFRDTFDTGNRTVIVLGDSFTEGHLADDNHTYSHLLDSWTPTTQFLNYGMGGYGTNQEVLVYQNLSSRIEHDLVILGFATNDVVNNLATTKLRPRLNTSSTNVTIKHYPKEHTGVIKNPYLQKLQQFLYRNTYLYHFFVSKLRQMNVQKQSTPKPPTGSKLERGINHTKKLFDALARMSYRNNAELWIVFIPNRGEINASNPTNYEKDDGMPYWRAERYLLQSIDDKYQHVKFLDPTSSIKEIHHNRTRLYGRRNGHLNERGYSFLADLLYKELVEEGQVQNRTRRIKHNDVESCSDTGLRIW